MSYPDQLTARGWVAVGAVSAALSVAAGAFGAHALRARLEPDMLAAFETAARYHMYHAIGTLAAAAWLMRGSNPALRATTWLFTAGTLLFSGSLYAMALTGTRALGAVVPAGGLCFILGWLAFAWGVWRPQSAPVAPRL